MRGEGGSTLYTTIKYMKSCSALQFVSSLANFTVEYCFQIFPFSVFLKSSLRYFEVSLGGKTRLSTVFYSLTEFIRQLVLQWK